MILRQAVRTVATGAPVPDGTGVEVRRRTDNGLIASLTTVNGEFEYIQNGNPGPFKVTVTTADEVKITSSWNVGPAGAADVSGLPLYFRLWTDGIIPGLWNNLSITANGSGMTVSAATGGAIVQGILYDQRTATTPAIAPSDPTNPRIDTVVVRVIPAGAGADIEGTSVLAVKTGTPAASPVAPTLTQTTALWEYALADVRVDAGVTAIAADKVTTRAVGATPGIGNEQIDDRVAALIVAGAGIVKTYDDTANTLTLATDNEAIQDWLATFLLAGAGVTKTYNDTANTLTYAADYEAVQDMLSTFLKAGIRTTLTYDDTANSLTIAHPAPYDGQATSGSVTLTANGGPFTTQTISGLVAARTYRVKAECHTVGYGDAGVTGEGTLHCLIGGVAGPESPYQQFDQGVDSERSAYQARDITGVTSVTVAWGWTHSTGTLTVRGTILRWHVEQLD